MKNIVRFEVKDRKNRWMGNYSTELQHPSRSPREMAIMNCKQTIGTVCEVYDDGTEKEIFNNSPE